MGDYTYINFVRSATGFDRDMAPSGTLHYCIKRGEAAMKLYLRATPATANVTGTNFWCRDAATSFAAHYLCMRLATQRAPSVNYARGMRQVLGAGRLPAEFGGYTIMAEHWWSDGIRVCDMYGRNVIIQTVSP